MIIEIVAPTLNRPEWFGRLCVSVAEHAPGVQFRCSIENGPRALTTIINDLVSISTADAVLILADDVELQAGCIDKATRAMEASFGESGYDGVIGINQMNVPHVNDVTEFAFCMIGRAFIDRFPGRQVFCPDYYHFSGDTELGLYAKSVERFVFLPHACLIHHHPDASTRAADATHRHGRTKRHEDAQTRHIRREKGLLWGASSELVNAE